MEKFLLGWIAGVVVTGFLGVAICDKQERKHINDIHKRDSVNNKNIEINTQLKEQIRLDSISFHEQLYPKK